MSGIGRIQEARETRGQGSSNGVPGREVWFRDGDQAFLSSVATGEEGDTNLDDLYMYTYNSGSRWVNLLDDPDVDKTGIPDNTRPSHKFAFWAYVHEIIHTEKRNDDWEVVAGPGGKKVYKESINDFRIISLTFGRSDYIWNQLVDIYNDWNGLNKGVMRIKRTGTGMFDTSYQLAGTARQEEIPAGEEGKIADLPTVKEYFKSRYGGQTMQTPSLAGVATSSTTDTDDLF
jgi:hypothetical protein|tara:strand:- start:4230 stop:4922 length:693 start_codon:yes stop_codon:yes gene_type:complete